MGYSDSLCQSKTSSNPSVHCVSYWCTCSMGKTAIHTIKTKHFVGAAFLWSFFWVACTKQTSFLASILYLKKAFKPCMIPKRRYFLVLICCCTCTQTWQWKIHHESRCSADWKWKSSRQWFVGLPECGRLDIGYRCLYRQIASPVNTTMVHIDVHSVSCCLKHSGNQNLRTRRWWTQNRFWHIFMS